MDHSEHGSLLDFFAHLMPHEHCFLWAQDLVPVYIIANLLIFSSYLTIAITLLVLWIKRQDYTYSRVAMIYGYFILLCGFGHLAMVINMFKGYYIFETYWHVLTAIVSVMAAIQTIFLAPAILRVPKLDHLSEAIRITQGLIRHNEEEKLKVSSNE